MNGSQNSTLKWSQEVAHTFSQWFSQGTIAKHTRVAISSLISLLWHLWGFDGVALVDKSEYPTLVYGMDQWNQCEWAGWVPFIASNHPYSHYAMSSCSMHKRTVYGLSLNGSWPSQKYVLTSLQICLTDQRLDQRLSASVTPHWWSALGLGRSALALKFLLLNLSPSGWTRSSHADNPWIIARRSTLCSWMVCTL
jgi:hypothetical protein